MTYRIASKMKLFPGCVAEYKRRHDTIWPELSAELKNAGISDYSIYFDEETGALFSLLKAAEGNTLDELSSKAIMKKWWDYMADIMETNPDHSPVSVALPEMFHMD